MERLLYLIIVILCFGCNSKNSELLPKEEPMPNSDLEAKVTSVEVTGNPRAYRFTVEISSPDTGCEQYADWWEVITPSGELIARRVLGHSHVNEQPFKRSTEPVVIDPDQTVLVRAHMNNLGYGTSILKGSVMNGFDSDTLSASFAKELETKSPLPGSCAF